MKDEKIDKGRVDETGPAEKDAFVWDCDLKGFGLKVTPRGKKIYIVQYRLGGRGTRTQRYTIGEHGSPWTPEKARREAKRLLGQVANEIDPSKERKSRIAAHRADAEAPTLAEFASRYIIEHARPYKKPRTVEEDERNLRLHIVPALGKLKVKDITSADITKFHVGRLHTPVNANRCRALLSHIFEKAEAWGERPPGSNPCRYVEKYEEQKRERFLSAEELVRFRDALARAETEEPPAAVAAIRLLILTGCRKSEILKLRWEWVDLERGCLVLPDRISENGEKTISISKNGAKIVPLGAAAMRVLIELPRQEGSPYVLPAERGNGHFIGVQKVWQRIRSAAGLEDVRIHDLRHSFASITVSGGDSLYLLGKVLGHSDARTTQRYAHLANDPIRAVADRTSEKIAAIICGGGASNVVPLPSSKRANEAAG
jgi:integrase